MFSSGKERSVMGRIRRCFMHTAATESACRRVSILRGGSGSIAAASMWSQTFAAADEYLIKEKYTRPEKLAIQGGSNGGLLMGAMITQHPDLFRAVVSSVG